MKTVSKPWGWYETLKKEKHYWVKIITVLPGQSTSLQYHKKRREYWLVLEGEGVFQRHLDKNKVKVGDNYFVDDFIIHRIINDSKKNFVVAEIALGEPDEDDIKRLHDNYNRKVEDDNPDPFI